MLVFWGLTRAPIDYELVYSPFLYFIIITITLILTLIVAKPMFSDSKDKAIFLAASLVGNTGNLGIPLGIALFGEQSVPYTSIINIMNIIFIYTVSIYFFAKEKFSISDAIKSMFKLPAIWFCIIALFLNYNGVTFNEHIEKLLKMAAYAAIVLQLLIFGMYLSSVKVKAINWRLSLNIVAFKHLILPLVGFAVILNSDLSPYVSAILAMQLMVPLAVNIVNLSALYECKPYDATGAVLVTSLTYVAMLVVYLWAIKHYFGVL